LCLGVKTNFTYLILNLAIVIPFIAMSIIYLVLFIGNNCGQFAQKTSKNTCLLDRLVLQCINTMCK